jgi:hypothetical protein
MAVLPFIARRFVVARLLVCLLRRSLLAFRFRSRCDRRCRKAFTVLQNCLHRTTFRDAFSFDKFEQVDVARHFDLPIALADPADGQLAAEAVLGVCFDAPATGRHAGDRHHMEAGRASATPVDHVSAIAGDHLIGRGRRQWRRCRRRCQGRRCRRKGWWRRWRRGRHGVRDAGSGRPIEMGVGRAHALGGKVSRPRGALIGNGRRWRRCERRWRGGSRRFSDATAVPQFLPRETLALLIGLSGRRPWSNQKQVHQYRGSGRKAAHSQTPSPSKNTGKNSPNKWSFASQAKVVAAIP